MRQIIHIAIAVLVTSLIWLTAIQDAKKQQLDKIEKMVFYPTYHIIVDLKKTSEYGSNELLSNKLSLLERRWESFIIRVGDSPDVFQSEIYEMSDGEIDSGVKQ